MGNCCSNETQEDRETSFGKGGKYKTQSRQARDINLIPLSTIIRVQSLIRGYLTRKMVKKIYGFEMSQGLLMRGTVHIEMDPEKLEEQRARVQAIRENLPEFEYGRDADEDYEPGIQKEQR